MTLSKMFRISTAVVFLWLLWVVVGPAEGELMWSTFLGSDVGDDGLALDVGPDGTVYLTGYTTSSGFPTTTGAYDTSLTHGDCNAFVTRFSPNGLELVYSTYLGGGEYLSDSQEGWDIAVDGSGNAYVVGWTNTSAFPTTTNAFDTSFNGQSDVFVTKLNPQGNALRWSTFLGGKEADDGWGLALGVDGTVYVSGSTKSDDFPVTLGAFDTSFSRGNYDAFVAKLTASGSILAYATYIGGSGWEHGQDVAVDKDGYAYVGGQTGSGNFYTTEEAWDHTLSGAADAFVVKLDAQGGEAEYATYLGGGEWDQAEGIAVDELGQAYLVGYTKSVDFPTTPGAYDQHHEGISDDVFVTKLNATGTSLLYSTFLGGDEGDYGHDIDVDGSGRVCLVGETSSENFPTTWGAFDRTYNGGFDDAFVTVLNAAGSDVEYSTFLGGSNGPGDRGNSVALDGQGNACAVGKTYCSDFPTTAGAFDEVYNGGWDVWVAKLNLKLTAVESHDSPLHVPGEPVLHQNVPNPFNGLTQIRYDLVADDHVVLAAYNIRGQKVAELVNARQGAGSYVVRWDAEDLASGVYFCRLRAGRFAETRKMVLVR